MYLQEMSLKFSELQQILQVFQGQVGPLDQNMGLLLYVVIQAAHRLHCITASKETESGKIKIRELKFSPI